MNRIVAVLFVTLVFVGALNAADKPLMHCFTFTAVDSATAADWEAFYKQFLRHAFPAGGKNGRQCSGVAHPAFRRHADDRGPGIG